MHIQYRGDQVREWHSDSNLDAEESHSDEGDKHNEVVDEGLLPEEVVQLVDTVARAGVLLERSKVVGVFQAVWSL